MRLDRLLFNLRFARSRTLAQRWIGEGHMRLNGARVLKQDQAVAVGDVLTLPLARRVAVIELLALPARRGPAREAQACYRPLDAGPAMDLGGGDAPAEGEAPQ
ncbi:MAG TPA: S4 domain-containing protein [Croceibacterium sp.]|nr:S4 domain-containing protein [Croceibacterium sp.]